MAYSTGTLPVQAQRKQMIRKPKTLAPLPPSVTSFPVSHGSTVGNQPLSSPVRNYTHISLASHSPTPSISLSPSLEQSTSFGRNTLKKPSVGPPPPPRRSPTTKLSKAGMEKRANNVSPPDSRLSSTSSSRKSSIQSNCTPYDTRSVLSGSLDAYSTSPAELELPVLPPPLPLLHSQTRTKRENYVTVNPNSLPSSPPPDLPPPPPPPPLSDLPTPPPPPDVMHFNRSSYKTVDLPKGVERGSGYEFPPPPN